MIKYLLIPLVVLLGTSGCSSRESILVPGQTKSDCEDKASSLGVCGTPKSVYAHRDKIKNLWFEEDQAYYIKSNGKIYNIDTDEEVRSGVKPEGVSMCPGCNNRDDSQESYYYDNGSSFSWSRNKNKINVKNRSLIIDTPQKSMMIRDLGWQQKIWIAPLETKGGDLVEAHGIHVVIKEPSWIIGEKTPKRVGRGVVVSSPFAREVLSDNHHAINKNAQSNINDYVNNNEKKDLNLESLKEYIESQSKLNNISEGNNNEE